MYTIYWKYVLALIIFLLLEPQVLVLAQDDQYDIEQIKENVKDACREYRLQCSNAQILIELSERYYSTEAFQTGHARVVYKKNDFRGSRSHFPKQ